MVKPFLKYFLYQLHLAGVANRLHFHFQQIRHRRSNRDFVKQFPGLVIPPDTFLHETYQLDYRKFIEDGSLTAGEISAWVKPYLPNAPAVLDWGCGAGRVIQHLRTSLPAAQLYACDTNEQMIRWNAEHYPGIVFTTIHPFVPMPNAPSFFNWVFGLSIFTHIDARRQKEWIQELHRILVPGGILLISTHGDFYLHQLLPAEKKALRENGIYTRKYPRQGHRLMSTYHTAAFFRKMILPYFTVLEYVDGARDPAKLGGQDLWILAKS